MTIQPKLTAQQKMKVRAACMRKWINAWQHVKETACGTACRIEDERIHGKNPAEVASDASPIPNAPKIMPNQLDPNFLHQGG